MENDSLLILCNRREFCLPITCFLLFSYKNIASYPPLASVASESSNSSFPKLPLDVFIWSDRDANDGVMVLSAVAKRNTAKFTLCIWVCPSPLTSHAVLLNYGGEGNLLIYLQSKPFFEITLQKENM